MKIKVLRGTVADGRVLDIGEIADVSDEDAKTLIQMGKAVPYVETAAEPLAETAEAPVEKPKRKYTRRKKAAKKAEK